METKNYLSFYLLSRFSYSLPYTLVSRVYSKLPRQEARRCIKYLFVSNDVLHVASTDVLVEWQLLFPTRTSELRKAPEGRRKTS